MYNKATGIILADTWLPFNATDIEDGMRKHSNDLVVVPSSPFDINKMYV